MAKKKVADLIVDVHVECDGGATQFLMADAKSSMNRDMLLNLPLGQSVAQPDEKLVCAADQATLKAPSSWRLSRNFAGLSNLGVCQP